MRRVTRGARRHPVATMALLSCGVAAVTSLSTSASVVPFGQPDLGGQAIYHGTRVRGVNPAKPPLNRALPRRSDMLAVTTHKIGRQAIEPTLGLDRRGRLFFAASAFDPPTGAVPHNRVLRSTDSGRTWTDVSPSLDKLDTHPVNDDAYVYVEPDSGRVFTLDTSQGAGSEMSFSDDGGATWTTSLVYTAGLNDHMTIVAAPPPPESGLTTSDPRFPKLLHYCANSLEITSCSRSQDGGKTFVQEGTPFTDPNGFCGALTGHLAADAVGRIFLASAFNHNAACPAHPLTVASSDDGGTTWRTSVVSDRVLDAEHDGELAVDAAGNVYVVWEDDVHRLPYLSVSRDHGKTWSAPVMIAPPGVRHARFSATQAGDAGRVAISFIGTPVENAADSTRPWGYYVVVSTDVLGANPTFRSALAPVPGQGYPVVHRGDCAGQCPGLFDFLDIDVDPRRGGPVWGSLSDNCTGRCSTSARGASSDPTAGIGLAVEQTAGPRLRPLSPSR
jgi:photosystem II stability/assembly factor-like uncharacterized protein